MRSVISYHLMLILHKKKKKMNLINQIRYQNLQIYVLSVSQIFSMYKICWTDFVLVALKIIS